VPAAWCASPCDAPVVFTLRCTARLLKRLGAGRLDPAHIAPTTRLGDWTCNLLYTPVGQLVLAVAERTLLPVILPARTSSTLTRRFPGAVREVLVALGVPEPLIDAEVEAMGDVRIGCTANRTVLGSMNDFVNLLRADIEAEPTMTLVAMALRLAEAPCGPIGMNSPDRATLELLAAALH
jgi:hypothetical protein